MKKIIVALLVLLTCLTLSSCEKNETIVVYTESGFAPFEYVENGEIVGVDVDIMNLVGEKLGKKIKFENVKFDIIVDAVAEGDLTNVGAAGLSITEARKQKVNFSDVYYQAYLYVIFDKNNFTDYKTMTDGEKGVYWKSLQTTKSIGVQTGTTADIFLSDEIAEGGSLYGTTKTDFNLLSLAVNAIGNDIDFVIIDELPAKELIKNHDNLDCLPLYYDGETDEIAFDEYAICVTKGETELLNAINEVLAELGTNGVQKLVNKHLGIEE